MSQPDLAFRQPVDKSQPRHFHALYASCVFHGLILSVLLWLTLHFHSYEGEIKNGATPGAASITILKLTRIFPPAKPLPIASTSLSPILPTPTTAPEHVTKQQPVETDLPVLAPQTKAPTPTQNHPIITQPHPSPSHDTTANIKVPAKSAVAAAESNYVPGPRELPQPSYPEQAQDQQQSGVVTLNVAFDSNGNVAAVEVTQSSGYYILDSSTRSFIRSHWHCPAYAGQTKSETVQYKLE